VIPVRIHDIDNEDVRRLEKELSGTLRSVDFIYRLEGVNRPLRPQDDEKNSDPTRPLYRNQIKQLANMIKDIIQGIKLKGKSIVKHPPVPSLCQADRSKCICNFCFAGNKSAGHDRQRPNIYLAWTSSDLKESREELSIILNKAGFNVLPSIDCPADDESFKARAEEEMAKCVCSLHMLSGEYGRRFESDDETSFPQFQFLEARKKIDDRS
jgi:hypothetical protein